MQLWCNSQRRKSPGSCWCLTITFPLVIFRLHEAASFYQRALLANALTSALRLHQRLPHFQLSRAFLAQALLEDSCHYLLYSLIFVNSYPVTSILFILMTVKLPAKHVGDVLIVFLLEGYSNDVPWSLFVWLLVRHLWGAVLISNFCPQNLKSKLCRAVLGI